MLRKPLYAAHRSVSINDMIERAKTNTLVNVPIGHIQTVYNQMPELVRSDADMVIIPSQFKESKIFGIRMKHRRNLIDSSQFFGSFWQQYFSVTFRTNMELAPDGSMTATKITLMNVNNGFRQSAVVLNAWQTFSIYMRTLSGTADITLYINDDEASKTVTVTNSWQRFTLTGKTSTNKKTGQYVGIKAATGVGDTNNLCIWGAQLELGTEATEYEPTLTEQNFIQYSNQFNSKWEGYDVNIIEKAGTSPFGGNDAHRMNVNSVSVNEHYKYISLWATKRHHTFSLYAKAMELSRLQLSVKTSDNANGMYASFNLSTGTVMSNTMNGVFADTSAGIEAVTNGWYRVWVSGVVHDGNVLNLHIQLLDDSNNLSFAGGNRNLLIWGSQFFLGRAPIAPANTEYLDTSTFVTHRDFNFSRPSNATMVDEEGHVVYAPHQLFGENESFGSKWTKLTANIDVASNVISPDGGYNAKRLNENTSLGHHHMLHSVALTGGLYYTAMIHAKALDRNKIRIFVDGKTERFFDLATGAILGNRLAQTNSSTITNVGNGWFRCTLTWKCDVSGTYNFGFGLSLDGVSESYQGEFLKGLYIYGSALNIGRSIKNYVYSSNLQIFSPRFQFDPVTKKYLGLLMEKASTNLFTYSQDFINPVWTKNNSTIEPDIIEAPSGEVEGNYLKETADSGEHSVSAVSLSFTLGQMYSFSVFAKSGGRALQLRLPETVFGTEAYGNFDLSAGVVGSKGSSATTFVENYGNGWFRCILKATCTTAGTGQARLITQQTHTSSGLINFVGDVQRGVYLWGAQLEASRRYSSYIPTMEAQATRTTEQLTNTVFGNWFKEAEGTWYFDYIQPQADTSSMGYLMMIHANSNPAARVITGNGTIGLLSEPGAFSLTTTTGITVGQVQKLAVGIQKGITTIYLNGAMIASKTMNDFQRHTENIGILAGASGQDPLNSTCKVVAYFNRRLSDSELQQLTSQ